MCLIVFRPENATLPADVLERGFRMNNDGWGIMYPRGDGKLQVIKGVYDLKTIERVFSFAKDKKFAMHFRLATHGEVDVENCHPFRVLSKETHGRDLYMMHNGILRVDTHSDNARSDTWHFVSRYVAPVLRTDPSLIDDKAFRDMIAGVIGTGNKLTFMDGEGETFIINDTAGTWSNGAWFSSGYGWGAGGSGSYCEADFYCG